MRFTAWFLCAALALATGACAFFPPPPTTDLALQDVSVIESESRYPYRIQRLRDGKVYVPALVVTLTSTTDIRAVRQEYLVWMHSIGGLCAGPDVIYDQQIIALSPEDLFGDLHGPNKKTEMIGRYTYNVTIRIDSRWKKGSFPGEAFREHDMRTDREDICLKLRGRRRNGVNYDTNTVVIPYARIRAALDQAGL